MNNNNSAPDILRREAKWRCQLCAGSGFTSIGYPLAGALYLMFCSLFIVVFGIAVITFSGSAMLIARRMFLVMLLLYVIECVAVLKAKVRELPVNRLRSAFIPIAIAQYSLLLIVAGMLYVTVGISLVRGTGMSPTLQYGEVLIYRKCVHPTDLVAGRLVLFRLSSENSWIKQKNNIAAHVFGIFKGRERLLITARILAMPGDKIAQLGGHYIVNGQSTQQAVGIFGRYPRAIAVPDEPNFLTVPDKCYFIAQDNPHKSFDSQVLAWARREDIVSTDIRHLVKDGRVLKKAE